MPHKKSFYFMKILFDKAFLWTSSTMIIAYALVVMSLLLEDFLMGANFINSTGIDKIISFSTENMKTLLDISFNHFDFNSIL